MITRILAAVLTAGALAIGGAVPAWADDPGDVTRTALLLP
jgi:hypothetical protein